MSLARPIARLVLGGLALLLPARAQAGVVEDVLACQVVDFQACPALTKAAASRAEPLPRLAEILRAPASAPEQRVKAALALSLLDAREHKDAFVAAAQALSGKPERVDVLAAQARLGDARAAGPLLELLAQDAEPRGQILAAGALGVLRHQPAVPKLIPLLGASHGRLQAAAAHALGLLGDKSAEPALVALAGAPKVYVPARVQALDALAALHSARAATLAVLLVDAPARDIGRAALRLLTAVPTAWAAPAVLFALDTPGLRGEAARAAAGMKLDAAGPKLVQLVAAEDLELTERLWLFGALARLKPPGAATALVRRLTAAPAEEKLQILRALPQIGDRTVVPDLVPLLGQPDRTLANNVVFALENLTGQNLGPDEKAWRAYAGLDGAAPAKADAGSAPAPRR